MALRLMTAMLALALASGRDVLSLRSGHHVCTVLRLMSHDRGNPSKAGEGASYVGGYKVVDGALCNAKPVYVRPGVKGVDIMGNEIERTQLYMFWLPSAGVAKAAWAVSVANTCKRDSVAIQLLAPSGAPSPDRMPVQMWVAMHRWGKGGALALRLGVTCASTDAAESIDVSARGEVAQHGQKAVSWHDGLAYSVSQITKSNFFIPGLAVLSLLVGSCVTGNRGKRKESKGLRRKYRSIAEMPSQQL